MIPMLWKVRDNSWRLGKAHKEMLQAQTSRLPIPFTHRDKKIQNDNVAC